MFCLRRQSAQAKLELYGPGELRCLSRSIPADGKDEGDGWIIFHSISCRQEARRYQYFHSSLRFTLRGQLPICYILEDQADVQRFASIMILSVMKHTKSTVKFWFIENFLSPTFLVSF